MMSVLQEMKGLTKELYVIILSRRKSSFHAKFQVHCSHGLPVLKHYNVLSGQIIIIFQEVKGLTNAYALDQTEICLHGATVSEIRVFKRRRR